MKVKSTRLTVSALILGATLPLWSDSLSQDVISIAPDSNMSGIEKVEQYLCPRSYSTSPQKGNESRRTGSERISLSLPLYGSRIGIRDASPDDYGLCRISTEGDDNAIVFPGVMAHFGGEIIGDTYWSISKKQRSLAQIIGTISSYSMLTGERLSYAEYTPDVMAFDIAHDPTTDTVYGCFFSYDLSGIEFGTIDLLTGERTTIRQLKEPWNSCAFDAEGQLWVLGKDGNFYKVDKHTGIMEFIGETGLEPNYMTSAAIDRNTGRFFTTVSPMGLNSFIAEIDKTTGKGTVIHEFARGDEITGLCFWGQGKSDGAPAKVESVSIDYPDGNLSGTVDFQAPVSDLSGKLLPADTLIEYHVQVDRNEVKSGQIMPGQKVSVAYTFDEAGKRLFNIYCANAAGVGGNEYRLQFIGKGIPAMPADAVMQFSDNIAKVSWKAVTSSADGGYINPSEITYTVTRMPDNAIVASGIKDLTVTNRITLPQEITGVYYNVTANYDGRQSEPAKTNGFMLGECARTPYDIVFDEEYKITGWKIYDNNGDGRTWRYWDGNMWCDAAIGNADDDDWLISVPVKLEAGKYYTMEADLKTTNIPDQMHEFEVKAGQGQEISDMSSTIIPATIVQEPFFRTYSGEICPATSGNYNVGFHIISKGNTVQFILNNMKIDGGRSVKVPARVDDYTITPDPAMELKATVAFRAPSKCYDGTALSSITKIEILRNDTVIHTYTSVAPGTKLSYEDNAVKVNGDNRYAVISYNTAGGSSKSEITEYVGIKTPGPVENLQFTQVTDRPGFMKVNWTAPANDVDGRPIPASKIKYVIKDVKNQASVIADNISDTEYEYKACEMDSPHLVGCVVYAETDGGRSKGIAPEVMFLGEPYKSPLIESFADCRTEIEMMYDPEGTLGNITLFSDDPRYVCSYDGDNGFAAFSGQAMNDVVSTIMGPVRLDMENPFVSVAVYGLKEVNVGRGMGANKNEFDIEILDGEEWVSLYHTVVGELPDQKWTKVTVPLDDYAGKTVQLRMRGKKMTYGINYTYIDRIHVGSCADYNLELSSFAVPDAVFPEREFNITAVVSNNGINNALGGRLVIYRDGEVIHEAQLNKLDRDETKRLSFSTSLSLSDGPDHMYKGEIRYHKDQIASDNTLSSSVRLVLPSHPMPSDLSGTACETGGAQLAWTAPVIDPEVETITEDMENGVSFEEYLDGWKFIDNDKKPIGGLNGFDLPGIIPGESQRSFFVIDSDLMPPVSEFKAFSGKKALSEMYCAWGERNDDWAISPCLSGNAQKLTFMAKSYDNSHAESLEVLYSSTTDDIESFESLRKIDALPAEWSLISVDLPEGAKYFALRCYSLNGGMMMIDDIKFETGGIGADLDLLNYRLTRDGVAVFLPESDVTSFVDKSAPVGKHVYTLSAVYNKGESIACGPVEVMVTKEDSSVELTADDRVKVVVSRGLITIYNPSLEYVTICDIDGRVIYCGQESDKVVIAVQPGIYLMKIGGNGKKLDAR